MATWNSRDAKAKFCELVRETEKRGTQVITRRGKELAVLVSVEEWRQLNAMKPPQATPHVPGKK
jgi:prevent-host-death family protein